MSFIQILQRCRSLFAVLFFALSISSATRAQTPVDQYFPLIEGYQFEKLTELSHLVGISAQNLSVLKTGKARAIRFSTLEKLCQALECTPGDLIEYRGPP